MATGHIQKGTMTPKKAPPHSTCDKFILRFNVEGLRRDLKLRAAQNERTLNAEIIFLIKRGLQAEGAKTAPRTMQGGRA